MTSHVRHSADTKGKLEFIPKTAAASTKEQQIILGLTEFGDRFTNM